MKSDNKGLIYESDNIGIEIHGEKLYPVSNRIRAYLYIGSSLSEFPDNTKLFVRKYMLIMRGGVIIHSGTIFGLPAEE